MNEETLFELAVHSPESERAALLDRECAGDLALRERVSKLLEAHFSASPMFDATLVAKDLSRFDEKPTAVSQRSPADPYIGIVLDGKYKLIQVIGQGGMGSVYMAQQSMPVKRNVAVKVIKAGMDSKTVLARFDAERQALAMMDHPNIAKVLDAGTTELGSPYFVMELVKGTQITKFCDENKLTPRQRLELFVPVCEAIQHSHQKGIIHRDIKPSNVLVAMYDDRAVPKVIDFGVAKATAQSLTDATMVTGFGALVGTPEYMSPEQASLNNLDIDTRSDVYSLGVLLYELLSGHTPVDSKSLEKAAVLEILRIVRDVEAPRLSSKLSSIDTLPNVAANRRTEPKKLTTLFRGELDWVLHKALEKDRTRRYATANGLARDIQRYLQDEIVEARPPSAGYRLRKFVKHHKGQVLAAGLLLASLLAGIAGTTWGLIRAEQRRVEAEVAQAEEARQRDIAEKNESKAIIAKDDEARQRALAVVEKNRAIDFQNKALDALRATTGEDVEKLIGEKKELTENEKAYLQAIAKRWQAFAIQEGIDQQSRAISAEGHFRVANLWDQLGRREDALQAYEQSEKIYQELADQFPQVSKYAEDLAVNHNNTGLVLSHLGRRAEAQMRMRKGLSIEERLVNDFPDMTYHRASMAKSHHNLAVLSEELGNNLEALESYRQALMIEEKLASDFPDLPEYRIQLAISYSNLGVLLARIGRHEEALDHYRRALAIREKLAGDFPAERERFSDLASSYNNYGNLLSSLGQTDKAVEQYRNSVAIKEKLASDYPSVPEYSNSLASSYNNLGSTLRSLGKTSEAVGLYRKALVIRDKLVSTFPAEPEYRQDLGAIYNNLGNLLSQANKLELALEQHTKAVTIREKLVTDFNAVPAYRTNLATSYTNLGHLLRKMDKSIEAEEYARKSMSILLKLTLDFPEVTSYRENLATSYSDIASHLADSGKLDDALEQYRNAIAIGEKLVTEHPSVPRHKIELGGVYGNTGITLFEADKAEDSLLWFQKAIEILRPVHESDAKSTKSERNLKRCYEGRSKAYDSLQKFAEAEQDWGKFIELSPNANKHALTTRRAKRLIRQGMVKEGVEIISECTQLPGQEARLWYEYACGYSLAGNMLVEKKQEYSDRAIELLTEAVKAGYDDFKWIGKDSDLDPLRDRDDFKKIIAEVETKSNKNKQTAPTTKAKD